MRAPVLNTRALLLAARTGPCRGPACCRSTDLGEELADGRRPSQGGAGTERAACEQGARSRSHLLAQPTAREPGVWYAGASAVFSQRGWAGFNDHRMYPQWTGGDKDGTPDGPKLHSIQVDHSNRATSTSACRAAAYSKARTGARAGPRFNAGCAAEICLPDPNTPYGHDPHCVGCVPRLHPTSCTSRTTAVIYRMERAAGTWVRVGAERCKEVGSRFRWCASARPRTVWVFPMDGSSVVTRAGASPSSRPAAYSDAQCGTGAGSGRTPGCRETRDGLPSSARP